VAQEALTRGQSVYDPVPAKGLLSKETLDKILRREMLTKPRARATNRE
jgi:aspartate ammonia-lyase